MHMFYDYDKTQPINNTSTLIEYYKNNQSKIDELNVVNDLLKYQITSLLRQDSIISFLTCTSIESYHKISNYINKTIEQGHEDYKFAKDNYNFIIDELHQISSQIASIKEIIELVGFSHSVIGVALVFDLNDNEFELHIPLNKHITVNDVFCGDYININVNKFQLYVRTSSASISCIWTGTDITKINEEVDLTKNYRKGKTT